MKVNGKHCSSDIKYNLTLDADLQSSRATSRAQFGNSERVLQEAVSVSETETCVDHKVYVQVSFWQLAISLVLFIITVLTVQLCFIYKCLNGHFTWLFSWCNRRLLILLVQLLCELTSVYRIQKPAPP